MARVKVCRLCGQHNEPDELFCVATDCGTSLADVSVVESDRIDRGAAEQSTVERGGIDVSGGGWQGRGSDPGALTVLDGALVQAPSCTLVFPWGRVPVAGHLGVGREAGFSPISGRLDAYSTVSRRHAVVAVARGQWSVRDLGSTNGTYLNGVRVAEGESRAIENGDRVGFSRGLQVPVEITAAGSGNGATGN